jgi:hypothetical protein
LVRDFVRTLRGETPSISATTLEDSLHGHLMGFGADRTRRTGTVTTIRPE